MLLFPGISRCHTAQQFIFIVEDICDWVEWKLILSMKWIHHILYIQGTTKRGCAAYWGLPWSLYMTWPVYGFHSIICLSQLPVASILWQEKTTAWILLWWAVSLCIWLPEGTRHKRSSIRERLQIHQFSLSILTSTFSLQHSTSIYLWDWTGVSVARCILCNPTIQLQAFCHKVKMQHTVPGLCDLEIASACDQCSRPKECLKA